MFSCPIVVHNFFNLLQPMQIRAKEVKEKKLIPHRDELITLVFTSILNFSVKISN
jgi:hypothetical protein